MSERYDRTFYVETTKLWVRNRRLNDHEYELSGTPIAQMPNGNPDTADQKLANTTALEAVYGELGLQDMNTLGAKAKSWLGPLFTALEVPATQGWTCTRKIREWEG